MLAVQYGMEFKSLALRLNQPPALARDLLRAHRETYRTFWRWSDAAVDYAMLTGSLSTVFGWTVHVSAEPIIAPCAIFPCKATALKCCAWHAALRRSAVSKSPHQSMTRF